MIYPALIYLAVMYPDTIYPAVIYPAIIRPQVHHLIRSDDLGGESPKSSHLDDFFVFSTFPPASFGMSLDYLGIVTCFPLTFYFEPSLDFPHSFLGLSLKFPLSFHQLSFDFHQGFRFGHPTYVLLTLFGLSVWLPSPRSMPQTLLRLLEASSDSHWIHFDLALPFLHKHLKTPRTICEVF